MLMSHSKLDTHVTRDELYTLPQPAALGARHIVRPFYDDVDQVLDAMGTIGATLTAEDYVIRNSKETGMPTKFFAAFQVNLPDVNDDAYALQIGLRGSYDQSVARSLGVGSYVFVCSNMAFSADVTMKTKQTTFVNDRIPRLLNSAIQQVPELALKQHDRFDRYRNTALDQRDGDAMLIEFVRRGALAPSQLGKALEQWDAPDHEEHLSEGRTMWTLHNAVTEAMKTSGMHAMWERTRLVTDLLEAA